MIEEYFYQIEQAIQAFPDIRFYSLTKKIYSIRQGIIKGSIIFKDDFRLDFVDVKDLEKTGKIKYRYQYMDGNDALIFRYDNAPHHTQLRTFPHHKHLFSEKVETSGEPTLQEILLEIGRLKR